MENFEMIIENDYADALGIFREVESSLRVMHQALQTECGMVTLSHLEDNLVIILDRLELAIKKFIATSDKQFANIPISSIIQKTSEEEPQESQIV